MKNHGTYPKNSSINAVDIKKRFGKIQALDGVSLSIESGTVLALLGPNGSGKTTLVRILTTLLKPDSGEATVGGYSVLGEGHRVRKIIGLAGQYPAVDEILTGLENLEMISKLYHLDRQKVKKRAEDLLVSFGLADDANRRVKTYSGGMRRRLDLAAALVSEPTILFLDEPTAGLDPRSRFGLWEVIESYVKQLNTVFLTTQYLEEADRLANRIAIIDKGVILREGTNQEMKECCGGETIIRVRIADNTQFAIAQKILGALAGDKLSAYQYKSEFTIPKGVSPTLMADIVRRFDKEGIIINELSAKPPTLDDVFMALTGHSAEENKNRNENTSKL